MKKLNIKLLIIFLITTILLSSCGGPNELKNTGDIAGFLNGLWDGITVLFSFIGSLFSENINIYEVHNNGGWYNFGFFIGISIFFGGGGASAKN